MKISPPVKKKTLKPIRLIKKANDLIEARHSLSTWEMRIFLKIIFLVNEEKNRASTNFIIPIRELIKDFKLENSRQSYQLFREAREALATRSIQLVQENHETGKWERVNKSLFAETAHSLKLATDGSFQDDSDGYIRLQLHEQIKPYLINIDGSLDGNYTLFDKQYIVELPVKTLRFYLLLKRFADTGFRETKLDDLRDIFDLHGKYKNYGNIKQRIIEKARRDLEEKTDIRFDYEELKGKGKTVVALRFKIYPNVPGKRQLALPAPPPSGGVGQSSAEKMAASPPSHPDLDSLFDQYFLQVKPFGISASTLTAWVHAYPAAHIEACVADFLEKNRLGKIKEPDPAKRGGYLRRLLETADFTEKQAAAERVKTGRTRADELADRQKSEKTAIEARKRASFEQTRNIAASIMAQEVGLLDTLTQEINSEKQANFESSAFETNAMFRVAVIAKVRARHPEAFAGLS